MRMLHSLKPELQTVVNCHVGTKYSGPLEEQPEWPVLLTAEPSLQPQNYILVAGKELEGTSQVSASPQVSDLDAGRQPYAGAFGQRLWTSSEDNPE